MALVAFLRTLLKLDGMVEGMKLSAIVIAKGGFHTDSCLSLGALSYKRHPPFHIPPQRAAMTQSIKGYSM